MSLSVWINHAVHLAVSFKLSRLAKRTDEWDDKIAVGGIEKRSTGSTVGYHGDHREHLSPAVHRVNHMHVSWLSWFWFGFAPASNSEAHDGSCLLAPFPYQLCALLFFPPRLKTRLRGKRRTRSLKCPCLHVRSFFSPQTSHRRGVWVDVAQFFAAHQSEIWGELRRQGHVAEVCRRLKWRLTDAVN